MGSTSASSNPASLRAYHGEGEQEDFLVLSGQCLLLIEGEERLLRALDLVHCPAWTEHVFVGAGDGPCATLAVGLRSGGETVYPVFAATDHRPRRVACRLARIADPPIPPRGLAPRRILERVRRSSRRN